MEKTLIRAKDETVETTADNGITVARKHFDRASRAFDELIEKLEAGDLTEVGDAKRVIQALEKANELLIGATQKAEDRSKKERGIAHDYAIDFSAARSEIGRRLACLRTGG